jgi:hypothetical protein
VTLSVSAYAQTPPGGKTVQLGDSVIVIVPEGVVTAASTDLVITGAAKAPKAVGTCTDRGAAFSDPGWVGAAGMPSQVAFYDADVVPRTSVDGVWREGKPSGKTEVAIIFPGYAGFTTLQVGWHLGKNADKGKCGPGYNVFYSSIIGGLPGPANMAMTPSK